MVGASRRSRARAGPPFGPAPMPSATARVQGGHVRRGALSASLRAWGPSIPRARCGCHAPFRVARPAEGRPDGAPSLGAMRTGGRAGRSRRNPPHGHCSGSRVPRRSARSGPSGRSPLSRPRPRWASLGQSPSPWRSRRIPFEPPGSTLRAPPTGVSGGARRLPGGLSVRGGYPPRTRRTKAPPDPVRASRLNAPGPAGSRRRRMSTTRGAVPGGSSPRPRRRRLPPDPVRAPGSTLRPRQQASA